jgi:phosphoglycolate phosphatase
MIRNLNGKSTEYDMVFFDLDGTLTDSGEGCMNGVRYMFENIGYTDYDDKKLRGFVGPPTKHHLLNEYGFNEKKASEAYTFYREYYDSKGIYENKPYDGIIEALKSINETGKRLYVATSKPEALAMRVLTRFSLLDLFSGVFAAHHDKNIYHKNEVLECAVRELGSVSGAVMVGDRSYDILGGKHVGMDTIGVLYGYGDFEELAAAGCDYTVDSVQDLAVLLGRG